MDADPGTVRRRWGEDGLQRSRARGDDGGGSERECERDCTGITSRLATSSRTMTDPELDS